jgi:hypothetical protein
MSSTRRVLAVAVVGCAAVGAVAAGLRGVGPLARLGVTVTRLQPELVSLLAPPGDPLVLLVGVTWTREGYCDGQFNVRVTETASEVTVGTVVSREYPGLMCAGLGTLENLAWADVRLAAPLGDRVVVRDSDGFALPIRSH